MARIRLPEAIAAALLVLAAGCAHPTNPDAWAKSRAMVPQALRQQRWSWGFDTQAMGALPPGFAAATGLWGVMRGVEPASPPHVLQQRSTDKSMAVLLLGEKIFADARVRAQVKFRGGKQAAGGLLFRYVDAGDYYLARLGTVSGRAQLGYAALGRRVYLAGRTVDGVARDTWIKVEIEARGNRIILRVDDRKVLELRDDQYPAGQVGLWTDGESVASFDDLTVEAL